MNLIKSLRSSHGGGSQHGGGQAREKAAHVQKRSLSARLRLKFGSSQSLSITPKATTPVSQNGRFSSVTSSGDGVHDDLYSQPGKYSHEKVPGEADNTTGP